MADDNLTHYSEIPVLVARLAALRQTIAVHLDWLKTVNDKEKPSPRLEDLYCLLQRLNMFSEAHFNKLKTIVEDPEFLRDQEDQEEDGDRYPPQHVLAVVLAQIADDVDVIRRAASDEIIANTTNKTAEIIKTANELVQAALEPAQTWLKLSEGEEVRPNTDNKKVTVITYFQKSPSVRLIPYDEDAFALIGIPYSCLNLPRDLLAIPHEVGHFVYWNGRLAADGPTFVEEVRRQLDDTIHETFPLWAKRWTEEIFADVYGCLVAGPVMALDFQDLLALESAQGFVEDDGEHPTPAIRPYIYSHILGKVDGWKDWTNSLNERWAQEWGKRKKLTKAEWIRSNSSELDSNASSTDNLADARTNSEFMLEVDTDNNVITDIEGENLKCARAIADIVFNLLYEKMNPATENRWRRYLDHSDLPSEGTLETVGKLYDAFNASVPGNWPKLNLHEPIPDDCQFDYSKWKPKKKDGSKTEPNPETDGTKQDKEWMKWWEADGWTTRGPFDQWP
jgi:hypothetical protein